MSVVSERQFVEIAVLDDLAAGMSVKSILLAELMP
jgi:hypothetical protein